MHTLIGAARRRAVGIAAGTVLAGGLAGGVLLTSGTAYAATTSTTAAITKIGGGNGNGHSAADIATYLSCPSSVYIGERGRCTLYVSNNGGNFAQDVTARINLPSQLRADSSTVRNLGSLYRGQTRELTVTFTAETGSNLWGSHRGNRFNVKVVGSASSNSGFNQFGNQGFSSSTAYVTIVPTGRWA